MKRPRPVSPKQTALQGVDLAMTHPQLERFPIRKPQPGDKRRHWGRSSLPGALVPLPIDARGQELRIGPLAVLQDVWGRHFVMDYGRALGDGEIFTGTKRACVVRMVELHTPSRST